MDNKRDDFTIEEIVKREKDFFSTNKTKSVEFRISQLKRLKESIIHYQSDIEKALWDDLRKSPEEAFLTEIFVTLSQINTHIKKLRNWAKPKRVKTPIHLFPSQSYIYHEPLGVALIISPWNYPFNLTINPLIGAISAGCCAILKPSPQSAATTKIVAKIISESFDSSYITVVEGAEREVNQLLSHKLDFIFFTGSTKTGVQIYKAAAENLTPIALELGGKSPCIVDCGANIEIAARRIAWGKWLNGGQTCIAPDYLLVHNSIKNRVLESIKREIINMYGDDIESSRLYPRLISNSALERAESLIRGEEIYFGGIVNHKDRYLSPTIVDNITTSSEIMKQEIFAPILPVLTFESIDEVINIVNSNPKPLSLYYFGEHSSDILSKTSSGGACINDTIMHIANDSLPFGGVGASGIGRYHNKASFTLFSNSKSVLKTPTWLDLPMRYPPFKNFKFVKKFLNKSF